MNIAVIDYQSGNLGSVVRALQAVTNTDNVYLANTPDELNRADRWVLPGQGAIPQAMQALEKSGLISTLQSGFGKKAILGICVGMQILFEKSEEISKLQQESDGIDHHPSLGWVNGKVRKFHTEPSLKIPHMGWSKVKQTTAHPLWHNIPDESYFYFAHSFYCEPTQPEIATGHTDYGLGYASAIHLPHLFAVQFHPEKSGRDGLQLLKNFVELDF